jgi:hypothetical protein
VPRPPCEEEPWCPHHPPDDCIEEFVLKNCPCHCEAAQGGAEGEHLVTMSELHALELRGVQHDDKVKMQLTMHMMKIETRIQKLGARPRLMLR